MVVRHSPDSPLTRTLTHDASVLTSSAVRGMGKGRDGLIWRTDGGNSLSADSGPTAPLDFASELVENDRRMTSTVVLLALLAGLITVFYFAQKASRHVEESPPEAAESRTAFKAAALVSISQNINSHLSLDRVLGLIVGYAGPMLGADAAFVFLPAPNGDLEVTAGWWKEHVFSTQDLKKVAEHSHSRGVTVSFPNREFDFAPEFPGMAVPIVAYDKSTEQPRTFGVLLCTRRPGDIRFTADDVDFLASFADQAAIAVRNAELYESLETANRRLRELDQLKNEFLEIVSHDIRSPLNAFIGLVDALLVDESERKLSEEERTQILTHLIERAEKVAVAAGETLSVSQIESGEFVIHKTPVALPDLARSVDVRTPRRCRLIVDVPAGLPTVRLDAERLRQLLNNLIDNAYKYSPDGGDVTLTLTLVHHHPRPLLRITVRDNGIGFDPAAQKILFRKFGRIDEGRGASASGTGLGLYICRKICEAHGGSIRAESAGAGKGATFIAEIPVEKVSMEVA